MDIHVHYGIGPDRAAVLCLAKMHAEPCPICEARGRAERAGDEELAKELKPARRVLVWVLNRNDEQQGPLAWAMPWTLDRDFCKLSRDKRSGAIYSIDDPYEGYDVSFEKEGEQQQTKYTGIQLSRRPTSVDEEHLEFISALPLPDILLWRDYDEIAKLYDGSGMEPERPAPARPPSPGRAGGAAASPAPARRLAAAATAAPARRAAPAPAEEEETPLSDEEYPPELPLEDDAPPFEEEPPPPPAAPARRPVPPAAPARPAAAPTRPAAPSRPAAAAPARPAAAPAAPSGGTRAAEIRAKLAARNPK
jgi:hypothetical protein